MCPPDEVSEFHIYDSPVTSVRRQSEIFFGAAGFDPSIAVGFILDEARRCGSRDASCKVVGEWWIIESSLDWLPANSRDTFFAMERYDQAPVNVRRLEILLAAFCAEVVTLGHGQAEVIVSQGSRSEAWIAQHDPGLDTSGRVIAFIP